MNLLKKIFILVITISLINISLKAEIGYEIADLDIEKIIGKCFSRNTESPTVTPKITPKQPDNSRSQPGIDNSKVNLNELISEFSVGNFSLENITSYLNELGQLNESGYTIEEKYLFWSNIALLEYFSLKAEKEDIKLQYKDLEEFSTILNNLQTIAKAKNFTIPQYIDEAIFKFVEKLNQLVSDENCNNSRCSNIALVIIKFATDQLQNGTLIWQYYPKLILDITKNALEKYQKFNPKKENSQENIDNTALWIEAMKEDIKTKAKIKLISLNQFESFKEIERFAEKLKERFLKAQATTTTQETTTTVQTPTEELVEQIESNEPKKPGLQSNLLAQIRGGAALRRVSDQPKPVADQKKPADPQQALLDAIKKGTTLKKASERVMNPSELKINDVVMAQYKRRASINTKEFVEEILEAAAKRSLQEKNEALNLFIDQYIAKFKTSNINSAAIEDLENLSKKLTGNQDIKSKIEEIFKQKTDLKTKIDSIKELLKLTS